MIDVPFEPWTTGNAFLDTMSDAAAALLLPQLVKIELTYAMPVARPGEAVERICFPIDGVISSVMHMRDGSEVEVSLIGREGFHGLAAVLGDGRSANAAVVQLPGAGYGLSSRRFLEAMNEDADLSLRTLRYAQNALETTAQFSGCNRLHELEQRCARWLLMVHDRVGRDDMPLTHEYLATMLGVNRPSVTLATGELMRSGYIHNRRGAIVMLDRAGLEKIACECYEHANGVLVRLMGYRIRPQDGRMQLR